MSTSSAAGVGGAISSTLSVSIGPHARHVTARIFIFRYRCRHGAGYSNVPQYALPVRRRNISLVPIDVRFPGVKRTLVRHAVLSAFDAVDGAHSAASRVP